MSVVVNVGGKEVELKLVKEDFGVVLKATKVDGVEVEDAGNLLAIFSGESEIAMQCNVNSGLGFNLNLQGEVVTY